MGSWTAVMMSLARYGKTSLLGLKVWDPDVADAPSRITINFSPHYLRLASYAPVPLLRTFDVTQKPLGRYAGICWDISTSEM
jgi:hypothetical protein